MTVPTNVRRIRDALDGAVDRCWLGGGGDLVSPELRRSPLLHRLPLHQRVYLSYVERSNGCWEWVASTTKNGYGQIRVDGCNRYAHRVSWELHFGPVPDGLALDHLCLTKACVNPGHLDPVTHGENTRRHGALTAHCPQGHAYDQSNTILKSPGQGRRSCRTCKRLRDRARHLRQRRDAWRKAVEA